MSQPSVNPGERPRTEPRGRPPQLESVSPQRRWPRRGGRQLLLSGPSGPAPLRVSRSTAPRDLGRDDLQPGPAEQLDDVGNAVGQTQYLAAHAYAGRLWVRVIDDQTR